MGKRRFCYFCLARNKKIALMIRFGAYRQRYCLIVCSNWKKHSYLSRIIHHPDQDMLSLTSALCRQVQAL